MTQPFVSEPDDDPVVLFEYRKSPDIICKVRLMTADQEKYIEFRDWLVTKNSWGRGYWIDGSSAILQSIASALLEVSEEI